VAIHLMVINMLIYFTMLGLLACAPLPNRLVMATAAITMTSTIIAVTVGMFATHLRNLADKKQDKFMRILTGDYYDF
jgi:membrane protein DedA with SNARE-associated domain